MTKCTIIFDSQNVWAQTNLEDMARSLDENLGRRGEGEAVATVEPGYVEIESTADRATLSLYVEAFVKRLRKDGFRIEAEYSE